MAIDPDSFARLLGTLGNKIPPPLVEKMGNDGTPSVSVDSGQDMARLERITCGSCVRFQPGTTKMGIGRCLATVTGLPPKEQRGYLAAYPMAPRRCPEYAGSAS